MIALCSKCYFVDGENKKTIAKGVSKKQNVLEWERYKKAFAGESDMCCNRGFRVCIGRMMTYGKKGGQQRKLGLSAYYDKRCVLPDGMHTEPLEYHLDG